MNIEKLARLDLNLLVCFKVLIEELNVTRAAHRLCLSQSAVSKSLAKLRIQFDDPLFTRNSHGLTCHRMIFANSKSIATIRCASFVKTTPH